MTAIEPSSVPAAFIEQLNSHRFAKRAGGLVAIALATLSLACASTGGGADGDDNQKAFRFEISCSGGQAIFQKIDNESGLPSEKGPVQLPSGVDCGDAEDMDEAAIRKFKRTGDWVLYYKATKTPIRKGRYANGGREGEWLGYDKKGRLDRRVAYQNGKKNGQETLLFAGTNNWRERGNNVDGKRDGPWESRFSAGSACVSKGSYSRGDKNGPWEECAQDPKTRKAYRNFAGTYLDGLRNGPAAAYNQDGKKIAEGNYVADTSEECRKKPPGGRKENCGKRSGPWKIYHGNGKLALSGSYDQATGNRSGRWTEYYQSGEKMAEGPREHTRRGRWKFWNKRGGLLFEGDFNGNDFSPRYAVIYENGRKTAEGELSIGLIKYDVNTDAIKQSKLIKSGIWKLYDASGRKIGEGEMVNGRKNGKWVEQGGTNCYMLGRPRECQ